MEAPLTQTCAGLQCPRKANCARTLDARMRDAKWLDDLPATDMRLTLCATAELERFEEVADVGRHDATVPAMCGAAHPEFVGDIRSCASLEQGYVAVLKGLAL